MSSQEQEMLNTRAIEIAAKANTNAERAIKLAEANHEKQSKSLHEHAKHDELRFGQMLEKMSSGFSGIYNRLWIAAGAVIAAMGTLVIVLLGKVL